MELWILHSTQLDHNTIRTTSFIEIRQCLLAKIVFTDIRHYWGQTIMVLCSYQQINVEQATVNKVVLQLKTKHVTLLFTKAINSTERNHTVVYLKMYYYRQSTLEALVQSAHTTNEVATWLAVWLLVGQIKYGQRAEQTEMVLGIVTGLGQGHSVLDRSGPK